jgi:hypothetical protein
MPLTHRRRLVSTALTALAAVLLSAACGEDSSDGGAAGQPPASGSGGVGGQQTAAGSGGIGGSAGSGGTAGSAGAAGALPSGGVGGEVQAGTGGTGGLDDAGTLDGGPGLGDASTSDAASEYPKSYAGELDGLFVDVPCLDATPLPLADGATCDHPPGTQHIEQAITFGGDPSVTYAVTLRVRGIWEPTTIDGGDAPDAELPFKVGGSVAGGSAIDYQQYSIVVSAPAQTYWLNDHQYLAHDIHKLDYEATLRVTGGATVTVTVNDGNERQIANWTEDFFAGLAPYDAAPSTGQSLHLDVLSVSAE